MQTVHITVLSAEVNNAIKKTILVLNIALICFIAMTATTIGSILLTYNMSAPTQDQALGLYADSATKNEINPTNFNWGLNGYVISNGTNILCWAYNSGNVLLNVAITPLSNVSCVVVYSPMAFSIAPNATQQITMTFSQVATNTTATWSFSLNTS